MTKATIQPSQPIEMPHNLSKVIGCSATFRNVLSQVNLVAPTDATVLIQGETGTGKEIIASAIHTLSSRAGGPLVELDSAAIPFGLLESELFGHERGAFTGALSQRIGLFELADRGTLFLDEVGDIPVELQPKLLRVLQEQEFERLGSNRTLRPSVRIIAATNRDLARMVAEQRFPAHRFYRLSLFPIMLPPLRDRCEDLPLLIRHFLADYARRLDKGIEIIPQQKMDPMNRYFWPGNVREVQNFIGRAAILTPGSVPDPLVSELQSVSHNTVLEPTTLEDAERSHILRILEETNGRIAPAAELLGLPRTTLFYKIRRLGIATRRNEMPNLITREGLPGGGQNDITRTPETAAPEQRPNTNMAKTIKSARHRQILAGPLRQDLPRLTTNSSITEPVTEATPNSAGTHWRSWSITLGQVSPTRSYILPEACRTEPAMHDCPQTTAPDVLRGELGALILRNGGIAWQTLLRCT
jgi:transcriptional regulator with AAA-type ATPase domain